MGRGNAYSATPGIFLFGGSTCNSSRGAPVIPPAITNAGYPTHLVRNAGNEIVVLEGRSQYDLTLRPRSRHSRPLRSTVLRARISVTRFAVTTGPDCCAPARGSDAPNYPGEKAGWRSGIFSVGRSDGGGIRDYWEASPIRHYRPDGRGVEANASGGFPTGGNGSAPRLDGVSHKGGEISIMWDTYRFWRFGALQLTMCDKCGVSIPDEPLLT